MRFEYMHVVDLGLIPLLIGGIKGYADRQGHRGAALLATLDKELEQLPRIEGFYLPIGRKFFTAPSFVQARDYGAVMQVCATPASGLKVHTVATYLRSLHSQH